MQLETLLDEKKDTLLSFLLLVILGCFPTTAKCDFITKEHNAQTFFLTFTTN